MMRMLNSTTEKLMEQGLSSKAHGGSAAATFCCKDKDGKAHSSWLALLDPHTVPIVFDCNPQQLGACLALTMWFGKDDNDNLIIVPIKDTLKGMKDTYPPRQRHSGLDDHGSTIVVLCAKTTLHLGPPGRGMQRYYVGFVGISGGITVGGGSTTLTSA
eukprot:1846259-Rhodomonas_salina.2